MPRIFSLLFIAATLAASSSTILANGCKFPEAAYPAIPSIPTQRALIIHRDGQETLIVESSYDTPSPTVGWVLPLPAEPTKLDIADPGLLPSLSMSLGPKITHDLRNLWSTPRTVLIFLIPLLALLAFTTKAQGRARIIRLAVALTLAFLLAGMLLPALTTAGGGYESAGIHVTSTQRVGSYDVSILRADTPAALSNWLTANSFIPLPPQAVPIVNDYIARKWCFAAARLRRNAAGLMTPHPIAATFPSVQPIYPMKLTSLAPGKTLVELFVASDRQALAEGFHLVFADAFRNPAKLSREYGLIYNLARNIRGAQMGPSLLGVSTNCIIGHPDAAALLWDGCVVTRLTATLTPPQMDHDIDLQLAPLRPYREHVYSQGARRDIAIAILVYSAFPNLFFSSLIFGFWRRPKRWELNTLVVMVLLPFLAIPVTYLTMPAIPVIAGRQLSSIHLQLRLRDLAYATLMLSPTDQTAIASSPSDFPRLLTKLDRHYERYLTNPFTNQPISNQRSPGNYSIRIVNDRLYLCLYDEHARELRLPLNSRLSTRPVL